jgi:hypothetical protein
MAFVMEPKFDTRNTKEEGDYTRLYTPRWNYRCRILPLYFRANPDFRPPLVETKLVIYQYLR